MNGAGTERVKVLLSQAVDYETGMVLGLKGLKFVCDFPQSSCGLCATAQLSYETGIVLGPKGLKIVCDVAQLSCRL